jgi:hypothetical protein
MSGISYTDVVNVVALEIPSRLGNTSFSITVSFCEEDTSCVVSLLVPSGGSQESKEGSSEGTNKLTTQDVSSSQKETVMLNDVLPKREGISNATTFTTSVYDIPDISTDSFRTRITENNQAYYECNGCDLATKSAVHLVSHIHNVHSKVSDKFLMQRSACETTGIPKKLHLWKVTFEQTKPKPSGIDWFFRNFWNFGDDSKEKREKLETFCCKECDVVTKSKLYLARHIEMMHSESTKYQSPNASFHYIQMMPDHTVFMSVLELECNSSRCTNANGNDLNILTAYAYSSKTCGRRCVCS